VQFKIWYQAGSDPQIVVLIDMVKSEKNVNILWRRK